LATALTSANSVERRFRVDASLTFISWIGS
jgi:hypothetical protein